MEQDTIFTKIIRGDLPSDKVFENDRILAIKDIYPCAPVHFLIISKKVIQDLQSVPPEDLPLIAEMISVAQMLALKYEVADAYRLLTNVGPSAGQTIFHLHFHLIG